MRLFTAIYTTRLITSPLRASLRNLKRASAKAKKARRKAQTERTKRIQALRQQQARTVVLRSTEEVNNALKLVKIQEGQERIKKIRAEREKIEAQTKAIKRNAGLNVPECPKCGQLWAGGLTECPNCKIELVKP